MGGKIIIIVVGVEVLDRDQLPSSQPVNQLFILPITIMSDAPQTLAVNMQSSPMGPAPHTKTLLPGLISAL